MRPKLRFKICLFIFIYFYETSVNGGLMPDIRLLYQELISCRLLLLLLLLYHTY